MSQTRIKKDLQRVGYSSSCLEDWHKHLIDLGFEFRGDDLSGTEEEKQEEMIATPQNQTQCNLIEFFNSTKAPSKNILQWFLDEINSDDINYALLRKYFRQGNKQLKALIVFGLKQYLTDLSLLAALVFFDIYSPILSEVVDHYIRACELETDLGRFQKIVHHFMSLHLHGYNPAYVLKRIFQNQRGKLSIVQAIEREHNAELSFITSDENNSYH